MSSMKLASSDLHQAVEAALASLQKRATNLVVGCSAGVDSTVLANVVCNVARKTNTPVILAHLHHGIRGEEANADEHFVRALAQSLNAEFVQRRVDVPSLAERSGLGIEATARDERYRFFDEVAASNNASVVMVAHTSDDVAETFLMNASRGTGIRGLCSLHDVRVLEHCTVVRPFLNFSKQHLISFAEHHGIGWREDASNSSNEYLRNAVRNRVIPALREVFGPDVTSRIALTASSLIAPRTVLERVVADYLQDLDTVANGKLRLPVEGLHAFEPSLLSEIVKGALEKLLNRSIRRSDVVRTCGLLRAQAGSSVSISGGYQALRTQDAIVVAKQSNETEDVPITVSAEGVYLNRYQRLTTKVVSVSDVHITADKNVLLADVNAIVGQLQWRRWRNGDRFVPFGMSGSTLVSDILTNQKIASDNRKTATVLADESGILWLCGLRPAERVRVTNKTTQVFEASISTYNVESEWDPFDD